MKFMFMQGISNHNIVVAVPMSKNTVIHAETASFCFNVSKSPCVSWSYIGTFSCAFSRNSLVEKTFSDGGEWTHIFFVDSDTVPPLNALEKLLCLDAGVAAGVYPMAMDNGMFWSAPNEEGSWIPMHVNLPKKPFEANACGGGCLLVQKEVFASVGWPWFKNDFQEKNKNNGIGLKSTEDVYFIKKVLEKGHKLVIEPTVICKHYNSVELLRTWSNIEKQVIARFLSARRKGI